MAAAPRKVGEATKTTLDSVAEWKDERERELKRHRGGHGVPEVISRWRYTPADGWPIDIRAAADINAARMPNQLQAGELVDIAEERIGGADGVVYLRLSDGRGWLFDQKPGTGVLCVREEVVAPAERQGSEQLLAFAAASDGGAGGSDLAEELRQHAGSPAAALWRELQRLQEGLREERERRKGRVAALRVLDEALRPLRAELAQEPNFHGAAESERCVVEHRLHTAERAFEELQEQHHQLLSRRAAQEAEIQRHNLEAKREDRAARERAGGQVRVWARDGQELEALKVAKIELAEVLMLVDEDRLRRRRELRDLIGQVEAAQRERALLRQKDVYVAPKGSFVTSMRRLWTVAAGRDDPFPDLELRVS